MTTESNSEEYDRLVAEMDRRVDLAVDEAGPRREAAGKEHNIQRSDLPGIKWHNAWHASYWMVMNTLLAVMMTECLVCTKILDEPHTWFGEAGGLVVLLCDLLLLHILFGIEPTPGSSYGVVAFAWLFLRRIVLSSSYAACA